MSQTVWPSGRFITVTTKEQDEEALLGGRGSG